MHMETKTRTVISIQKPTPMWATYIFRAVVVLVPIIATIIASDPGISTEFKARLAPYASGLVTLVWALSRVIGVDIKEEEVKQ